MRKAISIRQPWAFLIIRPDIHGDDARLMAYENGLIKDVENRSRDLGDPGGEVFIHASKTPADNYDTLRIEIQKRHGILVPRFEELKRGGIIGRAMFEPCVELSEASVESHVLKRSKWFTGPIGYPIFSAEPMPFVECKGALGFFKLPADLKLG